MSRMSKVMKFFVFVFIGALFCGGFVIFKRQAEVKRNEKANFETQAELEKLVLALGKYKKGHKNWPIKLESLIPGEFKILPKTPKPYWYGIDFRGGGYFIFYVSKSDLFDDATYYLSENKKWATICSVDMPIGYDDSKIHSYGGQVARQTPP